MKILITLLLLFIHLFSKEVDFKISYDPDYAPFSYIQDDKPTGLFIDIWKLWAKHNNYNIEFVNGVLWEDSINMVEKNEVDFFLGSRDYTKLISSNYFYEMKSSFFSLVKNEIKIEKEIQLNIGIIGKAYQKIILDNFPNANLKIYDNYIDSIEALKNNEIDLIYDDKLAIEFFTVQNKSFHLIKALNNLTLKHKINALSNNEEKAKIFNDGFVKIPINELLALEKKWILNEQERYYLDFKQQINLTKEEIEFLEKNIIKVSVSNSWEPFTFKSHNGDALGISSEYWKLISNKLNLKSENHFSSSFVEQLENIKNKSLDLIYSVGETSQRKEYSIFTKEYAKFPISISTKKDENFIENISMLKDKKIAIGNNFTAHNILKNAHPEMNFILVNSVKEGLDLVSKDKAYAFIDTQPVLFYNIAKYNFNDLKVTGNTGYDFSLKFMIRDDYVILESILNKAISSVSLNELNLIVNKWNNVQFQTTMNYDLFWQITLIILLILLAFIYRNLVLKNLNKTLEYRIEEKTQKLNDMNQNLAQLVEKKTNELIQKENILNQQSKMAAMGEMIENIAHQWRQPLSVISTVATGAKVKKDLGILNDEDFYESMKMINSSSQYLSSTIDDFRNFFNTEKENTKFNINTPIEKVLYLLQTKLNNRNIKIIKAYSELYILGLENEFIQVILNILNNSLDAFEDKKIEQKFIFITIYQEDKNVILKIKDNAEGIEENILNRVFEPYFTTKHKSQGTGIGLYMSSEIINKHMNGNLTVSNKSFTYNNTKCKGAEFKIELPIGE